MTFKSRSLIQNLGYIVDVAFVYKYFDNAWSCFHDVEFTPHSHLQGNVTYNACAMGKHPLGELCCQATALVFVYSFAIFQKLLTYIILCCYMIHLSICSFRKRILSGGSLLMSLLWKN